jgi:lysophospholipase L1-like esterase
MMKRPRLKAAMQNLGLVAGSLGLCFVALEVALRVAGYGNVEIYQPDPLLYWRLKPNQNCYTKIDRKPVRVNSLGTRGPEFQLEKPAGTLRILSLGDSKTFGWGLTEAESYSGLIEKALQKHVGSSRRVEVINAGVNAWSYAQMHAYFREYGLKYRPDVVVLADANLWTQFSEGNNPEFVKSFMRRVQLKNLLRRFATYHYVVEYRLKDVYERTRVRFIPIDPKQDTFFKEQQQKDPDAFFRQHIEAVCRLAITNGVKPVLLFVPNTVELKALEPSNVLRAKTQVSRELNVPLIDTTADLKAGGEELFLEGDYVHLNARGNELVAERLFAALVNLIQP